MKIILIPGMTIGLKRTDASKTTMSLGVLALAASLESNGYHVTIFDIDYYIAQNDVEIGFELYKKIVESLFESLDKPQVIGIYVAVGTLHHALNLSQEIKRMSSGCVTFLGGPHATAVHDEIVVNCRSIDYVLRGECDNVIVDFISAIENKEGGLKHVSNLSFVDKSGELQIQEDAELICDLDKLPVPAYYKHKTASDMLDIIPIDVGRGCPFNCTFCSTSVFWKKSYRSKSLGRIVKEMHHIKELFNAKKVFLMHDCLTADKRTLFDICDAIRSSDLNLDWGCAARLDHLDDRTLEILSDSNCTHLEIGIESGSALVRASINKKLDSDDMNLVHKLQDIHDRGFSLVLFFICGFANECEEDIQATIHMIRDSLNIMKGNGFFRLTYLELFAGTELYRTEKEKAQFSPNLLDDVSLSLYTKEQLDLSQRTNLFPEFYYVTNKNINPLHFRELSSVYSSFIKIIGTEFFLTYTVLLKCFKNDIHVFFETWKEFEKKSGQLLRESHVITEHLFEYIAFLSAYELPPYLKEVLKYELMIYKLRQSYLYHVRTESEGKDGCPIIKNSKIGVFEYDIPLIMEQIKKNTLPDVNKLGQKLFILVNMVTSEKINIIKINQNVNDTLLLCNGHNTIPQITEKLSVANQLAASRTELEENIKNLIDQFRRINIIKG